MEVSAASAAAAAAAASAASLLALGLGAIYVVKRIEKKSYRRKPFPTGINLSVSVMKQIILARLVIGVYDKASAKSEFHEWWCKVHYSVVSFRDLFTENMNCRAGDHDVPTQGELKTEDKHEYFIVFRRVENCVDMHGAKWVVACRGTKPNRFHDLKEDFLLWSRQLHKSKTSTLILKVVRRLCKLYGEENVCVAGHSLGAAYGMLVWRTLALENKFYVSTCLFNPPDGTAEGILRFYGSVAVYRLHLPKCITECVGNCVDNLVQFLRERIGNLEIQMKDMQEIDALGRGPLPDLYINKFDPISGRFAKYFCYDATIVNGKVDFTGFDKWKGVGMSLRRRIWDNCENFTSLPGANLHTAKKPAGLIAPHKLINWLRHDAVIDSQTIKFVIDQSGYLQVYTEDYLEFKS